MTSSLAPREKQIWIDVLLSPQAVTKLMDAKKKLSAGPGGSVSLPEDFGQEIPGQGIFEHRSGPPILPPHLLQVILNKVGVNDQAQRCLTSVIVREVMRIF